MRVAKPIKIAVLSIIMQLAITWMLLKYYHLILNHK